ncbi:MAG: CBS domain-containing protein [bacterium]|nr:CBS domain-containing protein [bacterium]
MKNRLVKDLMLPLSEYAVVSGEASLKDALAALLASGDRLPAGKPRHRAVLVSDPQGGIEGKVGQHDFIEALEPKYKVLGDVEQLSTAGLDEGFVDSIMENYRFWWEDLQDLCRRARAVRVRQVMKSVATRIDEEASVAEAMHMFVMARAQSLLVTRQEKVVGILRLSDVFGEVADFVTSDDCR